ncbi:MAG: DUF3486 family protein [Rhodocyclaceae bacterium]|nr:DUF3486 family protein [Rhodocyclaceae bacterium]
MGRRSKVDGLPVDVRRWLERALTESGFSGYEELESMLSEKGFSLSKSAIHRYGQKIERRFAAIKASTEAARILTEGAADDQDARSDALVALVQTELFDTLISLQEASEEEDQAARVKMLSSAAKNIATLTRASVNLKKFQSEVREKLKTAAEAVTDMAKKGGLSDAAAELIRQKILGVV